MVKLEKDTAQYIALHQLLSHHGKYLVALSGGADSVSLLLILQHLGYSIEACHCNFHLRGEESDRDELFCVELCQQHSIPLHRIHFDTKEYAALHKVSIEMAARDLRYRYFEQLRKDLDMDAICVAHHKDDSVETVLINLIRGTGINGLTGISPKNGHIIRPLLSAGRNDILSYLDAQHQGYVTDSTNLMDDATRNKIRLHIIPMLKKINPAVVDNIAHTAYHLTEANKMLQGIISESHIVSTDTTHDTIAIDKQRLLSQASPEFALHSVLNAYHFSGNVIKDILGSINSSGKIWQSSTHQLVIDRKQILVRAIGGTTFKPIFIPEDGYYTLSDKQKIRVTFLKRSSEFKPSKERAKVTLDADKIKFPLRIRRTQAGDRFRPFGMKGSKLISDYLTDCKCNAFEKEEQLVVEDATNNIVWLVGRRTSDTCRIDDYTQAILQLEITDH